MITGSRSPRSALLQLRLNRVITQRISLIHTPLIISTSAAFRSECRIQSAAELIRVRWTCLIPCPIRLQWSSLEQEMAAAEWEASIGLQAAAAEYLSCPLTALRMFVNSARIVAGVKPHRTTLPDLLGSYYGPTHSTHPWPGGVCHFNFPPLSSSTRWLQLVVYSFPRHLFVALTPRVAPLQLLAGELCNICERPNLPCFQLGLACSGSGNTLPRLPKH